MRRWNQILLVLFLACLFPNVLSAAQEDIAETKPATIDLADLPPVIRPPGARLIPSSLELVADTPAHYVVDTCCTACATVQ